MDRLGLRERIERAKREFFAGNLYFNRQLIDNQIDRSAIGSEMRFFSGTTSSRWWRASWSPPGWSPRCR